MSEYFTSVSFETEAPFQLKISTLQLGARQGPISADSFWRLAFEALRIGMGEDPTSPSSSDIATLDATRSAVRVIESAWGSGSIQTMTRQVKIAVSDKDPVAAANALRIAWGAIKENLERLGAKIRIATQDGTQEGDILAIFAEFGGTPVKLVVGMSCTTKVWRP